MNKVLLLGNKETAVEITKYTAYVVALEQLVEVMKRGGCR